MLIVFFSLIFALFSETYKCTNAYCSNGKVNGVCDKCDGKGNYIQSIESNVDINTGKVGYSRKKQKFDVINVMVKELLKQIVMLVVVKDISM